MGARKIGIILWVSVLVLTLFVASPAESQTVPSGKLVLVLGPAQAVVWPAVVAAGGVPIGELGSRPLSDVSVIVLGNLAYRAIPDPVASQLRAFVTFGGALMITGGGSSFGSGGYEVIQDVVPFAIRAPNDFVAMPFRSPMRIDPNHPAIVGGSYATIGTFNDMNPKPGTLEILRYPGGLSGVGPQAPLMAEERIGRGLVLGVAFDLAEVIPLSPEGQELMKNTMQYLMSQSAIPAPSPTEATPRPWSPPEQIRCVEMPDRKFACF